MKPIKRNVKRKCGCKTLLTSKNINIIGVNSMGLWYNCPNCHTTMVKKRKLTKETIVHVGKVVLKGFFSVHKVGINSV